MRKVLLFLFISVIILLYNGQNNISQAEVVETSLPTVILRAAKHADFFRIVLSSNDDALAKATISNRDKTSFRIDFPAKVRFELTKKDSEGNPIQLDPASNKVFPLVKGVLVIARPTHLTITVDGLSDIKVSRLNNPSRLVIDANIEKTSQDKTDPIPSDKPDKSVKSESLMTIDSLIIDAGHGGNDKGISSSAGNEKDIVLSIAKDFGGLLAKKGKKVIFTRKDDRSLEPDERAAIANQQRGILFISLHTSLKKEIVVYFSTNKNDVALRKRSEMMAQKLAAQLKQELQITSRVEYLPGLFIADIQSPAVLLELPSPLSTAYDKKNRELVLRGLLKGFLTNIKESSLSLPAQKPTEPTQQIPLKPKKKIADEI
jgi:N-acetylmuramoyl-L-alanine amidase